MTTYTKADLAKILADHAGWRLGKGGCRAYLSGADLSDADLSGADLSGADLSRANLSGADLSRANLSGADLSDADLSRANLSGADLSGADLSGADLSDAYLSGADLSGADLSRANLSGADLSGADLSDADLSGANLSGVSALIDAGYPYGWRAVGWLSEGVIRLRVGCRNFTLADGRAYWTGKDNRREVLAALDYIETIARIRGWEVK